MDKERKGYIDIFKFIFSICIIGIHTDCLNFTDKYNWYIVHGIFRLAVPFFFVSAGYFYTKKVLKDKNNIKSITKKYLKKLFIPFCFWLFVGLIINEYKDTYDKNIFYTFYLLIKRIILYPWGALWYILALMVSIYILSKFYSKNKYVEPLIIGFVLYLFALVCNSYYFVIMNNNYIKLIVDNYMDIFISARNGLFVGLLYVSIGGFLCKLMSDNKSFSFLKNILYFFLFYFLLIIEISIIKHNHYIEDSSLLLIMPILIFFLVSALLKINTKRDFLLLRKYSIVLYLIHRPILSILTNYYNVQLGLKCFIATVIISLIISSILIKINNKYINKLIML